VAVPGRGQALVVRLPACADIILPCPATFALSARSTGWSKRTTRRQHMKTMAEAFHHTLKDIYYAENALTKAIPKMIDAAPEGDIRTAFEDHLKETKEQVKLLKQVFKTIDKPAEGEKCDAIEGLIKEAEGIIEEASGKALGATLIGAAQAIEHYEIARYGTLAAWAKQLGYKDAAALLEATLKEESNTDATLSKLAETAVNAAAQKKVA
jgi:ferritin-like metal-binding protein YciE